MLTSCCVEEKFEDTYKCINMVKSCCAVGCFNRSSKGSMLTFCCFPMDPECQAQWIAAVGHKNWKPTEYTWLCGAHFSSGKKSNDPLSPGYVPSVFGHVSSPVRKGEMKMTAYKRRKESLKKRLGLLTSTPIASQCMPSDKLVDSGDKRDAATITNRLTSSASVTSRSALPKFHEFLMVLMKLRLNLSI